MMQRRLVGGAGLAIGAAVGTAIGVAAGAITLWLPVGAAIARRRHDRRLAVVHPAVRSAVHRLNRSSPMRVLALLIAIGLVAPACAASLDSSPTDVAPGTAAPAASGEMTVNAPGGTYTSVSPTRLAEMLTAKDFVLVNVHVPYEGEIDGTDTFLPYDQVANRLSELPAAKDARVLVYCRSGRMSIEAARTLVRLGYTNVLELDGGMIAWEQAGQRLVQAPQD